MVSVTKRKQRYVRNCLDVWLGCMAIWYQAKANADIPGETTANVKMLASGVEIYFHLSGRMAGDGMEMWLAKIWYISNLVQF